MCIRDRTMSCGASFSVSLYPMSGRQMKEFGVHGIVTRSQQLGRAIRTIKDCGDKTPEDVYKRQIFSICIRATIRSSTTNTGPHTKNILAGSQSWPAEQH